MASYLITGCSRGLGLALAAHLNTYPSSEVGTILATSRTESAALKSLAENSKGRVVFIQLDTTNEASIKNAVTETEKILGEKGLDVLINNAGIMGFAPQGIASMNDLDEHFTTNVLSVHHVSRAFIPLLQKGSLKKIVNVTTTLGSIAMVGIFAQTPCPAYKISKAMLNMLTAQYSLEYAARGFTIFAISPGWLRTDLGGDAADLSVEQGAKATTEKIMKAGKEQNGQFLNIFIEGIGHYDGSNPPW
ncbi:dehydrogenase [Stipitochalara longipes BDJ]|nr:dehydrogenase [Stipitochalara longipes BDJ]